MPQQLKDQEAIAAFSNLSLRAKVLQKGEWTSMTTAATPSGTLPATDDANCSARHWTQNWFRMLQ